MDENFSELSTSNKITFFLKKNLKKIYFFVFLILLSIFLFIFYSNYNLNKNKKISDQFNKANIMIMNNNKDNAKLMLINIINSKNKFYSPLALNSLIDNELISSNEEIIIYFDFIIKELELDSDKKDLITFKKAIFLSNFDKDDAIEKTLNPIIKSNSPVRNNAIKFLINYYEGKGNQKKIEEYLDLLKKNSN